MSPFAPGTFERLDVCALASFCAPRAGQRLTAAVVSREFFKNWRRCNLLIINLCSWGPLHTPDTSLQPELAWCRLHANRNDTETSRFVRQESKNLRRIY